MSAVTPEVVYVLPDKVGGVFSYVDNLLSHRKADDFNYAAVLTDNAIDVEARSRDELSAARATRFSYRLPPENIHAVLRRLARVVGHAPGVMVANDWIELAMATVHDTGRAVIAIAHMDVDYYYDLAVRHEASIDAFVAYTEHMATRLREVLPHRADSVFLLPYGVEIPSARRTAPATSWPLRLLYVGRLNRGKGVFDLPQIDAELRRRGCPVSWTVQGVGPDEQALRAEWRQNPHVRWSGWQPMPAVLQLYRDHDVLVMPSRNEGLPVALLEAGAAGVVPVVSNLPSGIPEVVEPGVTGFRPDARDIGGFVAAIERLHGDRVQLEAMSDAVRAHVARRFDANACTAHYQRLFARVHAQRRPWTPRRLPYGSRLDQPWIPNVVTKLARSFTR